MRSDLISKWTEKYKRAVETEWSILRVGNVQIRLEDVYVMLQALPAPAPKVQERRLELGDVPGRLQHAGLEREARDPIPAPVALSKALGDAQDLVLLGEPGSGKTTILQFIGLCFAHDDWSKSRLLLHEERTPVKINLREHAELLTKPGPGLENALSSSVREYLRRISEEQALELIQNWQDNDLLLVLLDGLDEVPDALRPAVQDEINRFAASEQGRKCRLVVSSRLAGYISQGGSFREFTLKPFEKAEESKPFLQGWLSAFCHDWPREKAESEAGWLYGQMAGQPALQRILDNPLLLRLSAEMYASKGKEGVARNRADLYRFYTNELWDRAVYNRGVDARQKDAVLEAIELLAWQLQLNQKPALPEAMFSIIHKQMGLVAWGGEVLVFSHTTFQEYFVGQRLRRAWLSNRAGAWAFLRLRLHIPEWREPILLMVGLLDGKIATDLVHKVLRNKSPFEWWMFRDQILAASLIAENEGIDRRERRMLLWKVHYLVSWWGKIRLGRIGPTQAPILLLTLIDAMNTLDTVPYLLRALRHGDKFMRSLAVHALGEMKVVEAVPDLERAFKFDGDDNVHSAASKALGEMKAMEAVPDLLQVFDYRGENNWGLNFAAAGALRSMNAVEAVPYLLQELKQQNQWRRAGVFQALAFMEALEGVPDLILVLKDREDLMRTWAAWALGRMKAVEAVPDLLQALTEDPDERVRAEVAKALANMKVVKAVPNLLRTLREDQDNNVRTAATYALTAMKAEEVVPYLLQNFREDQDNKVRTTAANALANMKVVEAVPDLLRALREDQDNKVRSAAARALADMKVVEAVPDLLRALKEDLDESVRTEAAWALGNMKAMEAMPYLVRAFKNDINRSAQFAVFGPLSNLLSTIPISNNVLSLNQQIKILQTLVTHKSTKNMEAVFQSTMANRLSALQAAGSKFQDPFQKYQVPPTQKAILFLLGFLILVFLMALLVVLDTFFGTVQDVFKHNFGVLIEPWISSHPILAFGILLVLGVVIAIVVIYRDRFAELLPGKPSKGV